jgi:hypothetical protein
MTELQQQVESLYNSLWSPTEDGSIFTGQADGYQLEVVRVLRQIVNKLEMLNGS